MRKFSVVAPFFAVVAVMLATGAAMGPASAQSVNKSPIDRVDCPASASDLCGGARLLDRLERSTIAIDHPVGKGDALVPKAGRDLEKATHDVGHSVENSAHWVGDRLGIHW
jgi:hypothetical protein